MKIFKLITSCIWGYFICALSTVTLSSILPFSNKAEAVLFATLLSYTIWLCVVLYAFSKVSIKALLIQLTLISMFLYLLNTYMLPIKG